MPSWSDQLVFLIWKAKQHPLSTAQISAPSYPYHASALTQIKLDHPESLAVVHLKKHIGLHHVIHDGHFFLLPFSFVCHHPFLPPPSLLALVAVLSNSFKWWHNVTWSQCDEMAYLRTVANGDKWHAVQRGEEEVYSTAEGSVYICWGQCLCFMHR